MDANMNAPQRPENLVEEASRFAAMRAPVLWTAGAFFNVLAESYRTARFAANATASQAWGRIIFHERDARQRLNDLEPRVSNVEQQHLAIEPRVAALEAGIHDGGYEEYAIEMDNTSRITRVRRYCPAEEMQKVVKFTPKSCTFMIGSSSSAVAPRRSGRLQERGERDELE